MKARSRIHKLRLVAGAALIGCVIAGAFFSWISLPFDPRVGGASAGAIIGAFKFHLFA